ncbi:Dabb family protein [Nocardia amikacinitolerans]|uniref:Dabb family protein n=1 Tax=Nocardia amikacinitolerans TaxID=756689 RepID=UPI003688B636
MKRWIVLSGLPNDIDADAWTSDLAAAATERTGVRHCSGGADQPGSTGGLGTTWDLIGDTTPRQALPELFDAPVDAVSLIRVASHVVPCGTERRIKRTLLLTVRPETPAAVIARFEADLMAMPTHIPAIRSWSLSRTDGQTTWTHAWEQEFADPAALNGDYLLHPYHWTHVDRWFDPEIRGSIVEPAIAHLYRWADGPVLT